MSCPRGQSLTGLCALESKLVRLEAEFSVGWEGLPRTPNGVAKGWKKSRQRVAKSTIWWRSQPTEGIAKRVQIHGFRGPSGSGQVSALTA